MNRLVVCVLALLVGAACARKEPAIFGRACVDDGECDVDNGLVCDPLRHQCAPPRGPPPIPGLTCADAHVLELGEVGGVFIGSVDVELGADETPTPDGAACAGGQARWVYARVNVPAAMAARVVATGQGKVNVAVLGNACEAVLDHACAAGSDVTLPLVEGDVTLAVAASSGTRVTITFEQLRCPAGFMPTETGCLGFLDVVGPIGRTGHQLTVIDEDAVVASGGRGDDAAVVSQVFSRRALRWRDLLDGADRFGHAAAVTEGFFFAAGGNMTQAAEILEPDTTRFFPIFEPVEAEGITGGTLTRISTDQPMMFVGGRDPVVALFADLFGNCDDSDECPGGFQCVAVFESNFDPVGVCVCLLDDCNRLTTENPVWVDFDSPLHLRFRQRHVAIDLAEDPQRALVLVTGGIVNNPDVEGREAPSSYVLFSDSLTWVQMPVEPSPRRDVVASSTGGGDVILVGGRGTDEAPLDLVELWTPLLTNAPLASHLARPRADLAGGLLGVPGSATTFIAIGGDDGNGPLATTELIDVVTGTVTVGPALPFALSGARAALLEDGDMLVVGGRSVGGALVDTALLLTEIGPTLVKPDVGSGVAFPEIVGDFCEEAVPLVPLEGNSGFIEGNTIGFQDDLDLTKDSGCNGVTSSRGFDVFFHLDVPAGATIDLELVDPISAADLVLAVYDSCPVQFPCIDGADVEVQQAEQLTIDVVEATSLFILVDGFIRGAPFNYRLEWTVTP